MIITVKNIEFLGKHGVYEEERVHGRRFQVDLSVRLRRPLALGSDNLDETLDYRQLAQIILDVGHGPGMNLIERMAHEIIERVMLTCEQVEFASIQIRKFATGVPGNPQWVGVSLEQERDT